MGLAIIVAEQTKTTFNGLHRAIISQSERKHQKEAFEKKDPCGPCITGKILLHQEEIRFSLKPSIIQVDAAFNVRQEN